ncbi:condensation domain-containing protein [Streptomyces sp. CB02400]|uniref:condensation domain-containing protein n=1 Tax=Streptomyces sp. CB02400 TaxID=1703944 RepID=UPI00093E3D70|nr:condensation domain-containing protein [Streptomyces sp. CB02400]OKJ97277.1 peptide synthase [Streptomyces sp. CB02400]
MSITTAAPQTDDGTAQRIPLSYNQQFLRAFDKGETDGAFGHRHTLVCGWRVTGAVDTDALQRALDDVVERHEVLRTAVVGDDEGGHQVVHPPAPVALEVTDLPDADDTPRDVRAEEFLNDLDAAPYPVRELPHLRAFLGRFDTTDAVLVLATHHTSTDAWSLQVLMRDLVAAYRARAAGATADLGEVAQYREFARYQQENADSSRIDQARAYWRERLAGAEITGITSDRPAQADLPSAYGVHRFVFDTELSKKVVEFARAERCTPFMVLAAAYSVLLRRRTGTTDVVFPTFSSGRYEERFADSVGPFFNFVPIRIDTGDCTTLADVLDRSRAACVGAYRNEIPFARIAEDSPALLAPFADGFLAVVAFEVLQSAFPLDGEDGGDGKDGKGTEGPRFTEIRRRTLSQQVSSAIPDGGLWAMDVLPGGELAGSLKFDHNRFDERTARELVEQFRHLLTVLSGAPQTPLAKL